MGLNFDVLAKKIDDYVKEIENPESLIYDYTPVSIKEFVEGKQYLNINNSPFANGKIHTPWMDELITLFGDNYTFELPYREVVYIASSGVGKSFISGIILSYLSYRDLIIRNLRRCLGLSKNTLLMLMGVSITATHANKIVFGELLNRITTSQWFNRNYRKKPDIDSELRFQKYDNQKNGWKDTRYLAFSGANTETAPIGFTMRGCILDEVNFYQYTLESKRKGMKVYDAAENVYTAFKERIEQRGNANFRNSSLMVSVTTARFFDSFAEKKELEALTNKKIYFKRFSLLDMKPVSYFMLIDTPNFYVHIEEQQIIEEQEFLYFTQQTVTIEQLLEKANRAGFVGKSVDEAGEYLASFCLSLKKVPGEFRKRFEKDFSKACREILSISVRAISPLFFDIREIGLVCNNERISPLDERGEFRDSFFGRRGINYFGHLDLSENTCAAGLCIGHYDIENKSIYIDLILQILASDYGVVHNLQDVMVLSKGGEVDIEAVERLIVEIKQRGFNFELFTTDQFQSLGTRQFLDDHDIPTEKKSVIRDVTNFLNIKYLIQHRKLDFYNHSIFLEELVSAERQKDNKISTTVGHIDVFEAVAGCTRNILTSIGGIDKLPIGIGSRSNTVMQSAKAISLPVSRGVKRYTGSSVFRRTAKIGYNG